MRLSYLLVEIRTNKQKQQEKHLAFIDSNSNTFIKTNTNLKLQLSDYN